MLTLNNGQVNPCVSLILKCICPYILFTSVRSIYSCNRCSKRLWWCIQRNNYLNILNKLHGLLNFKIKWKVYKQDRRLDIIAEHW